MIFLIDLEISVLLASIRAVTELNCLIGVINSDKVVISEIGGF